MESTSQTNEMIGLLTQMLVILQKKFPLPAGIKSDMISEQIFLTHSSSSFLLNGIIYYLISIADPVIGRIIKWPIGTQSQAVFNQTIIKALTQLCKDKEEFQFSFRTSISSILRDRKGSKFDKFMFELASNALRIANTNHGSRAVPIMSDVPVDDRVAVMRHTTNELNSILVQKRNPVSQKQNEELVEQLVQQKTALKDRSEQFVQMCPSNYKEKMNENGPIQQKLQVLEQWQADLSTLSNEQAQANTLLTSYNNSVDAIRTIIRENIAGEDLMNDKNGPILVKTASEDNTELPHGDSVSLPGFIDSSIVTTHKLTGLVLSKETQRLANDFDVPLEQSECLLSQINQSISEHEQQIDSLKKLCEERQNIYDERVAAEGGHEFPLPDLGLEIRVDALPAPYSPMHLIQSPGTDSPKRVLEEVRRRRRDAAAAAASGEADAVAVHAPKSSGPSRSHTNTSISQLTKSILQKQTLSSTLASQANSTIGDLVPLSSSSPVNKPPASHGNALNPAAGSASGSKPARSSLADVLNELDESNLSFWDVSADSSSMNSTFDSPDPPMIRPSRVHTNAGPSGAAPSNRGTTSGIPRRVAPAVQNGHSSGLPAPSDAPAAAPVRHPRRSIQTLIERLQKIKAHSTISEFPQPSNSDTQ